MRSTASRPAVAADSPERCVPVLQPIAPRRRPVGERMGMPPGVVQGRGEVRGEGCVFDPVLVAAVTVSVSVSVYVSASVVSVSAGADVGMRVSAAVTAMASAASMLDSFADECRVKLRRCVCASTTAMLMGWPWSEAYCEAAWSAMVAPVWESVGRDTTAGEVEGMAVRCVGAGQANGWAISGWELYNQSRDGGEGRWQ